MWEERDKDVGWGRGCSKIFLGWMIWVCMIIILGERCSYFKVYYDKIVER